MSPTNPGVLNSTKPGIHGERDSGVSGSGLSNNELTGQGSGMRGTNSGSVAHGDSISPTNPGVLHSTKPGIHGARDAGTGSGLSNSELMRDEGAGSGLTSDTTRSGLDSSTTGSGLGGSGTAGPQYTGTNRRDEGLVGSGVDQTGSGRGLTGSNTRDTGLTGDTTGSGLAGNQSGYGSGTTGGSDLDGSRGMGGAGGYGSSTGSGLTGTGDSTTGGYGSSTGSGLTGAGGYDNTSGPHSSNLENKMDPRVDSDRDRSRNMGATGAGSGGYGSTTGSGLTGTGGSTAGGSGLAGEAERYVEGSEKHHRGDGHPEDIVHPGPHVTGTAKALDPHLN